MKILWILILGGMGLWTIYWVFVRPVCLLAARMELFRVRHQLRMLSDKDCSTPIKQKLETFCNSSLGVITSLDLVDCLICWPKKGVLLKAEADVELISSSEMGKKFFEKMLNAVIASILANSALLLLPALVFVALALWISFFRNLINSVRKRVWFQMLYVEDFGTKACRA